MENTRQNRRKVKKKSERKGGIEGKMDNVRKITLYRKK